MRMKSFLAASAVVIGLAAFAATVPSVAYAQHYHHYHGGGGYYGHGGGWGWGGFAAGAAAGAILGGIAANQGYYYGPGPYAYEPGPVYVRPVPRYRGGGGCWISTDQDRGYGYYGPCN